MLGVVGILRDRNRNFLSMRRNNYEDDSSTMTTPTRTSRFYRQNHRDRRRINAIHVISSTATTSNSNSFGGQPQQQLVPSTSSSHGFNSSRTNNNNNNVGISSGSNNNGRTTDLLKTLLLLCIFALCSHIVNTLPQIQRTLDSIALSSTTTGRTVVATTSSGVALNDSRLNKSKKNNSNKLLTLNGLTSHHQYQNPSKNDDNNISTNDDLYSHITFFDLNIMDYLSAPAVAVTKEISKLLYWITNRLPTKSFDATLYPSNKPIETELQATKFTTTNIIHFVKNDTTSYVFQDVHINTHYNSTLRLPCLIHSPIFINTTEARYVKGVRGPLSSINNNSDIMVTLLLDQPSPKYCDVDITNTTSDSTVTSNELSYPRESEVLLLRRDWTKQIPFKQLSKVAQQIEYHQTDCTKQQVQFHLDNDYGLGSHLYLWTQAVCNAEQYQQSRIVTYNPQWLWRDQSYCGTIGSTTTTTTNEILLESPFQCYFPKMEQRCPNDHDNIIVYNNVSHDPRNVKQRCEYVKQSNESLIEYRTGAVEYIFQQLSPLVVQEAYRQVGMLFGSSDDNDGSTTLFPKIPMNLITVHIRWGDKFWEMDLVPIEKYIDAVHEMIQIIDSTNDTNDTDTNTKSNEKNGRPLNIYVASEDPHAVQEFVNRTQELGWNVFVDRTVHELSHFRPKKGNRASWTTKNTKGRAGLVALGSLLVALESNYFILTTSSNYSRLINDIRKSIIDKECDQCTHMIDLRPGIW